jgi:uncharacterized protein YjbJ (UPF0337 family)
MNAYWWYRFEGHRRPPPGSVKTPWGKPTEDGSDAAGRSARLAGSASGRHDAVEGEADPKVAGCPSTAPVRGAGW